VVRRTTRSLVVGSLAVVVCLAGCSGLGYLGYLIAPPDRKVKVPAEFDGLAGQTVAIVVYADIGVQYEYPYARLGVSLALRAELTEHIKDINVVDPRRVITYQDENIHWENYSRTKIGRDLGADYVLYVALAEYTMREPGTVSLYRGRISGQGSLYDVTKPDRQARVWHGDDFRVIYPKHAPTGQPGHDDSRIRYETEKQFARMLARKFYEHEVPKS